MAKSKTIAATSFLHPVTKKRVKRGDVVEDTKDIPANFLAVFKEAKEVKEDK